MKVKVGHPGLLFIMWSDPDSESQRLGWAGPCEYLAGSTLTFLEVEALLFTANLWCVFRLFLSLSDPCFEVFL